MAVVQPLYETVEVVRTRDEVCQSSRVVIVEPHELVLVVLADPRWGVHVPECSNEPHGTAVGIVERHATHLDDSAPDGVVLGKCQVENLGVVRVVEGSQVETQQVLCVVGLQPGQSWSSARLM